MPPPFGQKSKDGSYLLACCVKTCTLDKPIATISTTTFYSCYPAAHNSGDLTRSWDCSDRQSMLCASKPQRESSGAWVWRYRSDDLLDPKY